MPVSKSKPKKLVVGADGIARIGGRKLKPRKKSHVEVKRVAPQIPPKKSALQKKNAVKGAVKQEQPVIDTAKAIAFAMAIAAEKKRIDANLTSDGDDLTVHLSRRPTTRTQGKVTGKFPAADLKEFRRKLIDARDRAMNGVVAMRATGFNESEDHEADGGDGTNQTLRLQALGQMGVIKRTIQQIEEALHRIDDGTYGVCTVCGQLIRKPRLINQPFVTTCMECQSAMEHHRI